MSKIVKNLENFVTIIANSVNKGQTAVDKVLWGSVDQSPSIPAPSTIAAGKPPASQQANIYKKKVGTLVQSGLFNAMDAMNSIDICAILEYLATTSEAFIPGTPKRPRRESPSKTEQALYQVQDKAILVREAIDKFYAFPNEILTSFTDPTAPQAASAPGVGNYRKFQGRVSGSAVNQPGVEGIVNGTGSLYTRSALSTQESTGSLAGTAMQKYNLGVVGDFINSVFRVTNVTQTAVQGTTSGIAAIIGEAALDPEVQAALSLIPKFNTSINALTDFSSIFSNAVDYRTIDEATFEKLTNKLNDVRAVCVVIEGFSVGNVVSFVSNQFPGTDIRSQMAKLSEYVDPSKLIPTIKKINTQLESFINTCRSITKVLQVARGVLKVALVLVKIYRFTEKVIGSMPLPLMYATYNMVDKIRDAKQAATDTRIGLEKFLEQLNALLAVVLKVVIYLQQNTEALLQRLQTFIDKAALCDSLNNSAVLDQLKNTQAALIALNDELKTVISDYNEKSDKINDAYGDYTIRVVDEEVVDPTVANVRRRGIALDKNGIIVAQSDLTFATNKAVIIEEVKFKLVAMGLISPSEITPADLLIAESMKYLKEDTLSLGEFGIAATGQNAGLDITSYLDQIPTSRQFRERARTRMKKTQQQANQQITAQSNNMSQFLGSVRSGG